MAKKSKVPSLPSTPKASLPARPTQPAAGVLERTMADNPLLEIWASRGIGPSPVLVLLHAHFGTRECEALLQPHLQACVLHPPRSRPATADLERRFKHARVAGNTLPRPKEERSRKGV